MTYDDSDVVDVLTGFARALRSAGVRVDSGQVGAYCLAVALLGVADIRDMYWSGRACLVGTQSELDLYDQVFAEYFLPRSHGGIEMKVVGIPPSRQMVGIDLRGSGVGRNRRSDEAESGTAASEIEILRDRDFADCSDEEIEVLRRLIAKLLIDMPVRETRRTKRARVGDRPDLRSALREAIRSDGMVFPRHWRQRTRTRRPLVLLLDISGSMADYSRALLQFAHSASRSTGRVEVFCFGTRLTRVTDAIDQRSADEALSNAAEVVVDWEGGTMIGESIREYNRSWARRSGFRGAVVLICSDGLERGDPVILTEAMARLGRLSHRVVWVNPLKADPAFEPATRGMVAALPQIDVLVSGHNLASLEALAGLLPALG